MDKYAMEKIPLYHNYSGGILTDEEYIKCMLYNHERKNAKNR